MGRRSLVLFLAAALAGAPALAQEASTPAAPSPGKRIVKVTNAASTSISAIYVARSGSLDLSDDLLGKQVAGAGKTVTITAEDPDAVCVFDIEFLMNNGDTVTRKGVDLCRTTAYEFTP